MNILLTSAGRRSYMVDYFKQALKGGGKVFASNSHDSPALKAADEAVISPLIYKKDYVNFILNYCLRNKIEAIISLFDIDLPILSKSKVIFEKNGIKVIVSDYQVTKICNDKWETFKFLTENNIKTPFTILSLKDVKNKIKRNELQFPLIIKPRWGMGSIGIYQANNYNELKILYKKTEFEIRNSYLKYESLTKLDKAIIIQEKLDGQEYGIDVVNDLNKKYVTSLIKKKITMRSGETDCAITEQNEILSKLGKKLSAKLRHIANLDVDCFLLNKTEPYVLEMNCRFGGHYPFSHMAGANIPLAIIKWLQNQIPEEELFKIKYGVLGIKDIKPIILNNANQ